MMADQALDFDAPLPLKEFRQCATCHTSHQHSNSNRSTGMAMYHVTVVFSLVTAIFGMANAVAAPFAYIADFSGSRVIVIDTAGPSVSGTPIAVGNRPVDIVINPAGTRAYVANSYSDSISVIDTSNRTIVATIPHLTAVSGLALDASGTHLFAGAEFFVYEIDTTTNQVIGIPMAVAAANASSCPMVSGKPAVDPSGLQVYVPVKDCRWDPWQSPGMLSVIDVRNPTATANIEVGLYPTSATLDATRHRVYVSNWVSGSMSVVDTDTRAMVQTIALSASSYPTVSALDPSGMHLYVTDNGSGNASIINTMTGMTDASLIMAGGESYGIALTSDGAQAYVSNQLGSISVFDTTTHNIIGTPLAVGGNLVAIAIGRSDALFANGFE